MSALTIRQTAHSRSVTCPYCKHFIGLVIGETYPEPDAEDVCCWRFLEELAASRYEAHRGRWSGGGAVGGDRHNTIAHGSSEADGDNPWGDYATRCLEESR